MGQSIVKGSPVKTGTEPTPPDYSRVFRFLPKSGKFLISDLSFSKLSPEDKAYVFQQASHHDSANVEFVPNFMDLMNRVRIRDRLMDGKDVSLELEFNGIDLTLHEIDSIFETKRILDRIMQRDGSYPWLATDFDGSGLTLSKTNIRRNGYSISVRAAQKVWEEASAYWHGNNTAFKDLSPVQASGYRHRNVLVTDSKTDIGCQTIRREEWEYVANYYGWEPSDATFEAAIDA